MRIFTAQARYVTEGEEKPISAPVYLPANEDEEPILPEYLVLEVEGQRYFYQPVEKEKVG